MKIKHLFILFTLLTFISCTSYKEQLKLKNKIYNDFDNRNYSTAKKEISEFEIKYPHSFFISDVNKIKRQINEIDEENQRIKLKHLRKNFYNDAYLYTHKYYDDMTKITWYYYNNTNNSRYSYNEHIYAYIGKKDNDPTPWLRIVLTYHARDWLFVNKYIFKCNNTIFSVYAFNKDSDVKHGGIYEWTDFSLDDFGYYNLLTIIKANNVKVRFDGSKSSSTFYLTDTELSGLKTIFKLYIGLGGNTNYNDIKDL